MPAPLPPAGDGDGPAIRVSTVMFGEPYLGPDSVVSYSDRDGVLVELLQDGRPVATLLQSADASIRTALLIQQAATQAVNRSVDDAGKSLPLTERLSRLNNAFKKASK